MTLHTHLYFKRQNSITHKAQLKKTMLNNWKGLTYGCIKATYQKKKTYFFRIKGLFRREKVTFKKRIIKGIDINVKLSWNILDHSWFFSCHITLLFILTLITVIDFKFGSISIFRLRPSSKFTQYIETINQCPFISSLNTLKSNLKHLEHYTPKTMDRLGAVQSKTFSH